MYFYHIFLYSYYSSIHIIYSLIIYVFNIHSTINLYVFTIHITIHLYIFYYLLTYSLFRMHYSIFAIHYLNTYLFTYLLFTIYYLLFTVHIRIHLHIYNLYTYLDENPYIVEFDETPKFWYPRVARDAWINLTFCSDQL